MREPRFCDLRKTHASVVPAKAGTQVWRFKKANASVVPAKAGTQVWLLEDVGDQIRPKRVGLLYQFQLPRAAPLLDIFLPLDGVKHRVMQLEVHQSIGAVGLGE